MRRPVRYWMTGCAAVVMAGLVGGRTVWAADAASSRVASRYGKTETEQRIFERAGTQGYDVFARLDTADGLWRPLDTLIVFSAPGGGTPVFMVSSSDAEPSLPLSVRVRRGADGGTEVLCAATDYHLPPEVARDMNVLRRLVADALI